MSAQDDSVALRLFDDIERLQAAGPSHRRSEFRYLNSASIQAAESIRAFLETAFENYSGAKADIRGKFRSPENPHHLGAAFELVLHEIFRRQGLSPRSEDLPTGGRPDLKITHSSGATTLIEARMLQPNENTHYSSLCDALDEIQMADIEFQLRIHEEPSSPIDMKKFAAAFAAFRKQLEIETSRAQERNEPLSTFHYKEDAQSPQHGAHIEIVPAHIPGALGGLAQWDVPDSEMPNARDVRRGLESKKGKYRDAGAPYVVAICSAKGFVSESIFDEALFRDSPGVGNEDRRGLWAKGKGSRISAVLACYNFKPSSVFSARMQLIRNPNATMPLIGNPFGCEEMQRIAGRVVRSGGTPISTLLEAATLSNEVGAK